MKFVEAFGQVQKLDCKEAITSPASVTADIDPPDSLESTIQCKLKTRKRRTNDNCYIIDNSGCPLGKNQG